MKESRGENSESGTEAETMEAVSLLLRGGTAHRALGRPPTSNVNQEKASQTCPWANLVKTIFNWGPSWITPGYDKLHQQDKTNKQILIRT